MSDPGGTPAVDTRAPLPPGVEAALHRGIRGVLRLARVESDPALRARLTYLAVAVGGFGEAGGTTEEVDGPERWRADLAAFRELEWTVLDPAFVQRLRDTVPGTIPSTGWTVTARESDRVLVTRDGIRARAPRTSLEYEGDPGDGVVKIRVPALAVGTAPGFVVRKSPVPVPRPWSRIYLNVGADEAPWCLGPMTEAVARYLPLLVKVAAHPGSYLRRDACVVYLGSRDLARGLALVLEALERDGIHPHPGTPYLTREVSPGVGVADEPSDPGAAAPSHGRWAARLLLAALEDVGDPISPSTTGEAALLRSLIRGIRDAGRDPAHPHLRPDRVPLGPLPIRRRHPPTSTPTPSDNP